MKRQWKLRRDIMYNDFWIEIILKNRITVKTFLTDVTLYQVAIHTDVSLLSLSRRQSRAAGLQRMTNVTRFNFFEEMSMTFHLDFQTVKKIWWILEFICFIVCFIINYGLNCAVFRKFYAIIDNETRQVNFWNLTWYMSMKQEIFNETRNLILAHFTE